MNIEQAKLIPISAIMEKLNLRPQQKENKRELYFSAFRREKTPSLWVDTEKNLWKDFGDTKWQGGDSIHLVRAYLDSENEGSAVSDALRWLKNMMGFIPDIKPVNDPDEIQTEKTLSVKRICKLNYYKLIQYGSDRGISKNILVKYFQQGNIFNSRSQKHFYVLLMRNEMKGYELRNPYFKGCIGSKYITFIRGSQPKPDGINIFEGSFDYLSVIAQQEGIPLKNDTIILHSLSNLKKATAYIKNYGYKNCFTWMDNDSPGKEATNSWTEFCKTEDNLIHVPMNNLYAPYKDVNAAHVAKLEL